MKKTLYSLILDDAVVREVDILAHRMGTNRSSLINSILAEYVNYVTPEQRISNVLSAIEQLMQPSRELIPFFAPNSSSMSMKSSLEYKYRPTIKYEVELYREHESALGQLSVLYRSQSAQLIADMTDFFRLWKNIEDRHLAPVTGLHDYALYEGKFVRSLSLPETDCSAEQLAQSISEYVKLFDKLLKAYLSGGMDAHQVEAAYYSYMINAQLRI
ncbi:MAG: hypothetical protein IJ364_01805 [Oscillospiraceae bacterium]|nr:hypothetical protein [Oscillospiraceae bacterium]